MLLADAPRDEESPTLPRAERMGRDSARLPAARVSAPGDIRWQCCARACDHSAFSGAATWSQSRNGRLVRVSGLVTHLQHPQTAKGVIFASLEDETGINNIIFWPACSRPQRHNIIGTNLMIVTGELQNEEGVIHVVAHRRRRLLALGAIDCRASRGTFTEARTIAARRSTVRADRKSYRTRRA